MSARTITIDAELLDQLIESARTERTQHHSDIEALRLVSEGAEYSRGLAQGRKDGAVDRFDALVRLRDSVQQVTTTGGDI